MSPSRLAAIAALFVFPLACHRSTGSVDQGKTADPAPPLNAAIATVVVAQADPTPPPAPAPADPGAAAPAPAAAQTGRVRRAVAMRVAPPANNAAPSPVTNSAPPPQPQPAAAPVAATNSDSFGGITVRREQKKMADDNPYP